jgi:hypothetical protein
MAGSLKNGWLASRVEMFLADEEFRGKELNGEE